jgi:hypothetical protein
LAIEQIAIDPHRRVRPMGVIRNHVDNQEEPCPQVWRS